MFYCNKLIVIEEETSVYFTHIFQLKSNIIIYSEVFLHIYQ